jgi:hypothetical protein
MTSIRTRSRAKRESVDYRQRDPTRWLVLIATTLATLLALALIDRYL